MEPALPPTASPSGLLAYGDFFFRHRNTLFPLVLAALCVVFPPRLAGGSLEFDRWLDLAGLAVVLAGQALRAAVIGFAYIKRGGRNKRVHAASLVTTGLFGVCRNPLYLGNLLIVGSIANIIVVSAARPLGVSIGFRTHLRTGLPVTAATLAIAALWMVVQRG